MPSPFGRLALIVNPRAGRGQVGREMPDLERRIRAGRLDYRILETARPGEAVDLVRGALEEDRFIVAVGGDGTVHEVLNGMIEDDRLVREDAVLGVVAAGSGCDFVRTFGLPDTVTTAVRHLLTERAYPIDVGKITYSDDEGERRTRYFANIAQAGLGAAVVRRAERLPRSFGRSRYFLGFWMALGPYRPCEVHVRSDKREYQGRANNVVIANCQFYGGGMRISPRSYPTDGAFDVQVSIGPKSEAFTLLPKIYRGDHLPSPNIEELKGSEITVEAERPLPVEADGEVLGMTPVRITVLHELVNLKI